MAIHTLNLCAGFLISLIEELNMGKQSVYKSSNDSHSSRDGLIQITG